MKWTMCDSTKVCEKWHEHAWKEPTNKSRSNNATQRDNIDQNMVERSNSNQTIRNRSTSINNNNANIQVYQNNGNANYNVKNTGNNHYNNAQVQHIAAPSLPRSNNNTSFNVNCGNVHNMNSHCNNNRYHPMWS